MVPVLFQSLPYIITCNYRATLEGITVKHYILKRAQHLNLLWLPSFNLLRSSALNTFSQVLLAVATKGFFNLGYATQNVS